MKLSPVILILVVLNAHSAAQYYTDQWYAAASEAAAAALIILGPTAAGLAAWESGRLRRGGVPMWTSVRSPLSMMANALTPIALLTVVGGSAAFITVATATPPTTEIRPLVFVPVLLASVAGYAVLGFAAGTLAKPSIVVPILVPGVLLWLVYPKAMEPFWLRHLTGNFLGQCCDLEYRVGPGALLAPVLVALGLAGTAIALTSVWVNTTAPDPGRWAVAVVSTVAGLTGAFLLVRDYGPEPTVSRTDGLHCEVPATVRICLWSENLDRMPDIAAYAERAIHGWKAVGITPPEAITERPASSSREWQVAVRRESDFPQVVTSLASGLLPAPACAKTQTWSGGALQAPLVMWLVSYAGVSPEYFENRFDPVTIAAVNTVLRQPEADQRKWFTRSMAAYSRCAAPPVKSGP